MKIPIKQLNKFKKLYKQEVGPELSDKEVESKSRGLLILIEKLLQLTIKT